MLPSFEGQILKAKHSIVTHRDAAAPGHDHWCLSDVASVQALTSLSQGGDVGRQNPMRPLYHSENWRPNRHELQSGISCIVVPGEDNLLVSPLYRQAPVQLSRIGRHALGAAPDPPEIDNTAACGWHPFGPNCT